MKDNKIKLSQLESFLMKAADSYTTAESKIVIENLL